MLLVLPQRFQAGELIEGLLARLGDKDGMIKLQTYQVFRISIFSCHYFSLLFLLCFKRSYPVRFLLTPLPSLCVTRRV